MLDHPRPDIHTHHSKAKQQSRLAFFHDGVMVSPGNLHDGAKEKGGVITRGLPGLERRLLTFDYFL